MPSWAWVVGGAGIALGAVSVGFGVNQVQASNALDANCGGAARDDCPAGYDFEGDRDREVLSQALP